MTKSQQKQINNLKPVKVVINSIYLSDGKDITIKLRELLMYPECTIEPQVEYGYDEHQKDIYNLVAFKIESQKQFEGRRDKLIQQFKDQNNQKVLAAKTRKQQREKEELSEFQRLKNKYENKNV